MASAEESPVVSEIVSNSGNYTFRALFEPESSPGEHWKGLMHDLEPLGCWFDTWSETLIAISVATTNAPAVADYLAARESEAELKYETGRTS